MTAAAPPPAPPAPPPAAPGSSPDQELLKQLFETYYKLIEHQRHIVQFSLWVAAALFAGLAWLWEKHPQAVWAVPLAGILTAVCTCWAGWRAGWVIRRTLEFGSVHAAGGANLLFANYLRGGAGYSSVIASGFIGLAWIAVFVIATQQPSLLAPLKRGAADAATVSIDIVITSCLHAKPEAEGNCAVGANVSERRDSPSEHRTPSQPGPEFTDMAHRRADARPVPPEGHDWRPSRRYGWQPWSPCHGPCEEQRRP